MFSSNLSHGNSRLREIDDDRVAYVSPSYLDSRFQFLAAKGHREHPVRSVSFRDDSEASSTDEEAQRASYMRNKLGRLEGSRCVAAWIQSMNAVDFKDCNSRAFARMFRSLHGLQRSSILCWCVCDDAKRSEVISLHMFVD